MRISVISPGLGLWVLGVSSGLGSSIFAPSSISLSWATTLFMTPRPDALLIPRFRPRHVVHSLPIPPLIASHTSGLIMRFLSFKTISNQVRVPCSSCWCHPRLLYNPEIASSIPEHLTKWLRVALVYSEHPRHICGRPGMQPSPHRSSFLLVLRCDIRRVLQPSLS